MTEQSQRRLAGIVCLAMGVMIVVGSMADKSVTMQREWIVLAAAAVFMLAGIQLIRSPKGRLSYLLGGMMCALFSGLGWFVAFTEDTVEGGLFFLPKTWNQAMGHVAFGVGAVITGVAAISFFVKAWNNRSVEPQ